jgi:hypothetical protein
MQLANLTHCFFYREYRNSRPGKFCIKTMTVPCSLSAGCEVKSESADPELSDGFAIRGSSDSGGGLSQLKGACLVSEDATVVESSSHVGSVWPKSMRRPAAQNKAHESHLIGGILREESVVHTDARPDSRGSDANPAHKQRQIDNVGSLMSGLNLGVEEQRYSRKQIPHRSQSSA